MGHQQAASSGSSASTTTAAAAAVASSAATNLFGLNFMGDPSSGPILYMEPNRTSALEDIRSVIIYISFATLLFGFLIILPGIRHDKIPTFVFIPTSLFVTASIFIALNGTTWHVGEAPISAAYKAFSRDRIQGDISVKIGLQSVNITLNAHKYYLLHSSQGPMMMENNLMLPKQNPASTTTTTTTSPMITTTQIPDTSLNLATLSSAPSDFFTTTTSAALTTDEPENPFTTQPALISEVESSELDDQVDANLQNDASTTSDNKELLRTARQTSEASSRRQQNQNRTRTRSRPANRNTTSSTLSSSSSRNSTNSSQKQQINPRNQTTTTTTTTSINHVQSTENKLHHQISTNNNNDNHADTKYIKGQKYSIKRINVDINYNERFYWIEPNQMRQEHHNALKRGLPYPILTVVEYLSQDEAGFSWSRQYRQAGYYTYILLCLTLSCCLLMFLFHCAAPTYAIYTLILIGCLLLLTNFTYAMLVPRANQSLVIPFEGQKLTFNFGFDFKLTFVAGCISIIVGSILAIVNIFCPLTTILDHDFDAHHGYYRHQRRRKDDSIDSSGNSTFATPPSSPGSKLIVKKPSKPPFNLATTTTTTTTTTTMGKNFQANIVDKEKLQLAKRRHSGGGSSKQIDLTNSTPIDAQSQVSANLKSNLATKTIIMNGNTNQSHNKPAAKQLQTMRHSNLDNATVSMDVGQQTSATTTTPTSSTTSTTISHL